MLDLDPADLDLILTRAEPAWRELGGKRLLVTGGTGFFGRWLLAGLVEANRRLGLGVEAVVLSRDPDSFRRAVPGLATAPGITLWPGDVRTFDFPPGRFSHVVHAATDTSRQAAARPLELIDSIVAGTRRVLEFAHAAGAERLLLTSSGAIYGAQPPGLPRLPEDYAGAPLPADARSSYGHAKRMAEHLATLAHADWGLGVTVARCFAFVGPWLPLDSHFAIGNFIGDALNGEAIRVGGDGRPVRSYLYAADLSAWLWTILVRGTPNQPYNIGSDASLPVADLAAMVARTLAPAPGMAKPVRIANPIAAGTDRADTGAAGSFYVPDISRARRELGLDAWTDLPTAIARTAAWAAKQNPNAWAAKQTSRKPA